MADAAADVGFVGDQLGELDDDEPERLVQDVGEVDESDDIATQINELKKVERFYTTGKVAELFNVTAETVRNWIEEGKLKAVKVNGQWRVPRSNVLDYANKRYAGSEL